MGDHPGAPEVALRRGQSELRARLQAQLTSDTERLRQAALAAWAADDEAPYPRMADLREQAELELRTLLNGLGRWAAVRPDEVFGRRWWERPLP